MTKEDLMGLILLLLLIVLVLASVPAYPYSRDWGYRPSSALSVLLVVLLVLLIIGIVPWGVGPPPHVY
jgi:multisubunit Na+/H+ antiporter MnhB subunit